MNKDIEKNMNNTIKRIDESIDYYDKKWDIKFNKMGKTLKDTSKIIKSINIILIITFVIIIGLMIFYNKKLLLL